MRFDTALRCIAPSTSTRSITRCAAPVPRGAGVTSGRRCGKLAMHWGLGSSGFCRRSTLQAGRGLSHAPVGDRVRLAPRPHRSFRRPLRRRLFHASAHAPAAAGRAPVDAPSSCTRPLFSPHPLDPTRRHPHRRRRRSPPFARRHGYCTAVVLCGRDVCAVRVYIGGQHLRKSTPFLERRILQVGVFGGSGEHTV